MVPREGAGARSVTAAARVSPSFVYTAALSGRSGLNNNSTAGVVTGTPNRLLYKAAL